VEALARYGRSLGIAFQIADDLLDVVGSESAVGKTLGTDLEKHKPTLPVIRVLQLAAPPERAAVIEILESDAPDKRVALLPWFDRFDAVTYARASARRYSHAAAQELSALRPSPAVESLRRLSEFVVKRSM
jgi:octaprenyl-diphosphate synthase